MSNWWDDAPELEIADIQSETLRDSLTKEDSQRESSASPMGRRPSREAATSAPGLEGVGDSIMQGLSDIWPAAKGTASLIGQVANENLNPYDMWKKKNERMNKLYDRLDRRSRGEGLEEEDPLNSAKNMMASLAKGGNALLNAPGNIRDYAVDKFPDQLEGAPSMRIPGVVDSDYDYGKALGVNPENLDATDQFLGEIIKRLPASAATLGNPVLMEILRASGENENVIPAASIAKIMGSAPKTPEALGKVKSGVGRAGEAITNIPETLGDIKESMTPKVFRESAALEQQIGELKGSEIEAKAELRDTKTDLAQDIAGQLDKSIEKGRAKQLEMEQYAPKSESASRATLFEQTQKTSKAHSDQVSKTYKELYDAPSEVEGKTVGQKPVTNWNGADYLQDVYGKEISMLIDKGLIKATDLNPSTVSEMISLKRKLSNAQAGFAKDGSNLGVEYVERVRAAEKASKIGEITNDIRFNLEENLTPEQFKGLEKADLQWEQLEAPWKSENILYEAGRNRWGSIPSENFFESINRLNKPELVASLLEDSGFTEALAKHDLMNVDFSKPGNVAKALEGDFGKMLPPKVRQTMNGLLDAQIETAALEQLGSQISMKEVRATLTEPKMKQIFKEHPDLKAKLQKRSTIEEAINDIREQLVEKGESQKVAAQKAKSLKDTFTIAASVVGVGTVWGFGNGILKAIGFL